MTGPGGVVGPDPLRPSARPIRPPWGPAVETVAAVAAAPATTAPKPTARLPAGRARARVYRVLNAREAMRPRPLYWPFPQRRLVCSRARDASDALRREVAGVSHDMQAADGGTDRAA